MLCLKRGYIDLRAISIGASGIFATQLKSEAAEFAIAHGWRIADVLRAANRFSRFYTVGQFDGVQLRLLKEDGSWTDMPHPGIVI
jgi:hypothetical protein